MAHPSIDTVIFDLGGVLIDWNPRYLYRKLFKQEADMEQFLSEVCTHEWNTRQDAGRSLQEATDLLVKEFPQQETYIRAYYGRWEEMLGGVIEGTVEMLNEIRQSGAYRLYALTNWSAETLPIALERFAFFQQFDGMVVSGEERLIKPYPEIYRVLFDRFEVAPERAVYIDDSFPNVLTARELGLHAFHFQSPETLRQELAEVLRVPALE